MTATWIEFQAVARSLHFTHAVRQYGYRSLTGQIHGLTVLLIQVGIGAEKARKNTKQFLVDSSWDLIISTGFAGDLETSHIGSIIIGKEIISIPDSPLPSSLSSFPSIICHPDWVKVALDVQWTGGEPLRTGKLVSVDWVLTKSDDKHRMGFKSGAVGVDMESAAIGKVAKEHGIAFLIIRAVSDGVNEDLPVDFNLFLTPSGWVRGIMDIITTPKSWRGFFTLYRHSNRASHQLTQFFEEFFLRVSKLPPMGNVVAGQA